MPNVAAAGGTGKSGVLSQRLAETGDTICLGVTGSPVGLFTGDIADLRIAGYFAQPALAR